MEQELICPKCKGNKFSLLAKDTFKCAYCGNILSIEKKDDPAQIKEPEQTTSTQPAPQIIYINAPQPDSSKTDNNSNKEDNYNILFDPEVSWKVKIMWIIVSIGIVTVLYMLKLLPSQLLGCT